MRRITTVTAILGFVVTAGACGSSSKLSQAATNQRCAVVFDKADFDTGSSTTITSGDARAALSRAHRPVPVWLAAEKTSEPLALCDYTTHPSPDATTPKTICPNGASVAVGPASPVYLDAVDAHSHTVRLPNDQVNAPGILHAFPASPDACQGLGGNP